GTVGQTVPVTDFAANFALYKKVFAAIQAGLIRSVHDCSDGGLWVALAESAMAGRLGFEADAAQAPQDPGLSDAGLLFGESQGRFVVSVPPEHTGAFETLLAGAACARIGTVTADTALRLRRADRTVIDTTIDAAFSAWRKPLDF